VHHRLGHPIGFLFTLVPRRADNQFCLWRAAGLLHDMGQFMRQQPTTTGPMGIVLTMTEINIPTSCERDSAESAVQRICAGIGVQANITKINAERGFHLEAYTRLQRLATAARTLDCFLHT
jgi:hypothetical protein